LPDDGEREPIEHLNVTKEDVQRAEEELEEKTDSIRKDIKKEAKKAKKVIQKEYENAKEELRDPVVSGSIVFALFVASGATCYINHQHKLGKLTWPLATGVAVGVAIISGAQYYATRAFVDRKH
jgi:hypothetical protein